METDSTTDDLPEGYVPIVNAETGEVGLGWEAESLSLPWRRMTPEDIGMERANPVFVESDDGNWWRLGQFRPEHGADHG